MPSGNKPFNCLNPDHAKSDQLYHMVSLGHNELNDTSLVFSENHW